MAGSIVPLLGILTSTQFKFQNDQYRNVLGQISVVGQANNQLRAGSLGPRKVTTVVGPYTPSTTTPNSSGSNTGGSNTTPVLGPPSPPNSNNNYNPNDMETWLNSTPPLDPSQMQNWPGAGNGIPPQTPSDYQVLGTDANNCPYYGIDENGKFLYGRDKDGNIITDPKALPCYVEKPASTNKETHPALSNKKSYAVFNAVGLCIVATAVGVAIYKYKSKKTKQS